MKLGSLEKTPAFEVKSRSTGEVYTLCRTITDGTSITDFAVRLEDLPPGHRSSAPHAHTKKHELYLVLRGSPTVHVNGEASLLTSGDYIVFEAGAGERHYLENTTAEPVELLSISSCPPDDVTHYT